MIQAKRKTKLVAESVSLEEKKRLKAEAEARWRREPGSTNSAVIGRPDDQPRLHIVPCDRIVPWQGGQIRKVFDPNKLQELADSIEEKGVLQPILLRPRASDDGKDYEIVAGERRWRASVLAKQETIPAIIRFLTDKEALEIQVIENLQRSDLSPIEEAEGYKRLLDEHGYTADSLAGKLGKSKSYVYGRLKLTVLPTAALEAVEKGLVPASIGELIGRLPSPELREKLWKGSFSGIENDWFRMPSFRDVKTTIDREYMRELKGAPFSQTDKKLVPEAGDCKSCPKRTGNNRVEYPDGRADICTDVNCFKLKVEAFQKRQLEAAASEGIAILPAQESKRMFGYSGQLNWDQRNRWIDLADECYQAAPDFDDDDENFDMDGKPAPTYADLLGDIKPDAVGQDHSGKVHRLVTKERAAEILRSKHGIEIEKDNSSPAVRHDPEREEQELQRKARALAVEKIAEKVAKWYDQEFLIRSVNGGFPLANLLRTVAYPLLKHFDDWGPVSDTLKRRNALETAEEPDSSDEYGQLVTRLLEGGDAADLIGVLAEVCVREQLFYWSRGYDRGHETSICDFANLKPSDFEKQALDELSPEKAKPESKPKAKAKKAAKAVARA